MNHMDEMTCLLYLDGQLEAAHAAELAVHLDACSDCRRLLVALQHETLAVSQALLEENEPVPARLLAPHAERPASWGWMVALGLAASGIYTLWTIFVEPSMTQLDQVGFGGYNLLAFVFINGALWKGWNDMLQFIILGSIAVLGAVLLFLVRRNLRRLASLSVLLAVPLLLSLALPPPAQATEFVRTHSTYELPSGETRHGDIFVFANSAHIDGTLDGDLFFFGHSLTVDGQVNGDVFAFANAVRIKGKVGGNVRAFNESITIEGEVARNVLGFVSHFELPSGAKVDGSATLFVGNMQVEGQLGRDLCAFFGEGYLDGTVGGEVRLYQSRHSHGIVQVGPRADVAGSFHYRGLKAPDVSSKARLASAPQVQIVTARPEYLSSFNYWYNAMIWGMAFVMGLVFISVAPGLVQETSREVARLGAPLGLGLVSFIVLPIAAVIACVTVVGLGLGISALFLWVFMLFFAQVFAAVWLGEAMLGVTSGTWPMTGRLALGLFVLRLGALIPFLGGWVRFLSCVLGMGALALVIYRRMQRPAAPPQAIPAVTVAPAG